MQHCSQHVNAQPPWGLAASIPCISAFQLQNLCCCQTSKGHRHLAATGELLNPSIPKSCICQAHRLPCSSEHRCSRLLDNAYASHTIESGLACYDMHILPSPITAVLHAEHFPECKERWLAVQESNHLGYVQECRLCGSSSCCQGKRQIMMSSAVALAMMSCQA